MAGLLDFLSLKDMFDGGGAGASGTAFKGGPLSGLLNELGIRPMGYRDAMERMKPMARPAAAPMAAPASPASPAAPPMAPPPPVAVQPLVGSLTPEDIMAAINRGAPGGPNVMQPQRMPTLQELLAADQRRLQARAVAGYDIASMFPQIGYGQR